MLPATFIELYLSQAQIPSSKKVTDIRDQAINYVICNNFFHHFVCHPVLPLWHFFKGDSEYTQLSTQSLSFGIVPDAWRWAFHRSIRIGLMRHIVFLVSLMMHQQHSSKPETSSGDLRKQLFPRGLYCVSSSVPYLIDTGIYFLSKFVFCVV